MEEIARFDIHVTSSDTKTHINRSFEVNKEYSKLVFDVSYSPKYLEDVSKCMQLMRQRIKDVGFKEDFLPDKELAKAIPLANHISWSIDSPKDGYLGTKHKHNPHQILEISEEKSSFGFMPAKIVKGTWNITSSMNAILTDDVDIHIIVSGE